MLRIVAFLILILISSASRAAPLPDVFRTVDFQRLLVSDPYVSSVAHRVVGRPNIFWETPPRCAVFLYQPSMVGPYAYQALLTRLSRPEMETFAQDWALRIRYQISANGEGIGQRTRYTQIDLSVGSSLIRFSVPRPGAKSETPLEFKVDANDQWPADSSNVFPRTKLGESFVRADTYVPWIPPFRSFPAEDSLPTRPQRKILADLENRMMGVAHFTVPNQPMPPPDAALIALGFFRDFSAVTDQLLELGKLCTTAAQRAWLEGFADGLSHSVPSAISVSAFEVEGLPEINQDLGHAYEAYQRSLGILIGLSSHTGDHPRWMK